MSNSEKSIQRKWAEFRFSVIGQLLSSPPTKGELKNQIVELSSRSWTHPITGEKTKFSFSSIERWYYQACKNAKDPMGSLIKNARSDYGKYRTVSEQIKTLLKKQYFQHRSWSYQLHRDNLFHLLREMDIEYCPSYSTIKRYLQTAGLYKKKKRRKKETNGTKQADYYQDNFEIRSFENEFVNGLWHLDFHACSREIVTNTGEIIFPAVLAIVDDHSRLICHIQWYLQENAENLVHGFCQALAKRGIPRALMTDNGKAMLSAEFTSGLTRLSIKHETTLAYSPYQNGKSEKLWSSLESRLMSMMENMDNVTLKVLNDCTFAWSEYEYNKAFHDEIGTEPLTRFLTNKNVGRFLEEKSFRHYFRREDYRNVRQTDGTVLIESKRFEIPIQYVHFKKVLVRYAKWDLSSVHLVDLITGKDLCPIFPLNKHRNAESGRRRKTEEVELQKKDTEIPAILAHILSEQEKSGLPPAYIHKED